MSTKFVYDNLILDERTVHPEIDGLIGDLKKRDLVALAGHMGNLLETVTIKEYPVIDTIKQTMRKKRRARRDDEWKRPYRVRHLFPIKTLRRRQSGKSGVNSLRSRLILRDHTIYKNREKERRKNI